MAEKIDMLIIDPQIDFCRKGSNENDPQRGSLYVPGADEDMERAASLIDRFGSKIDQIHVSLDCHHRIDIAHPLMWRNSSGESPFPFTIISADDIKNGVWVPIYPHLIQRFIKYCEELEKGGRYPLCIWPEHCLIGTDGNRVLPVLEEALARWEVANRKNVDYISKGSNPHTEHYSAIKAEVHDPADITTQANTRLITRLEKVSKFLYFGEAGSHCVKSTAEDIATEFGSDEYLKKMVMITDCVSPVISPAVDFPAIQDQFIKDMKEKGMQTSLSTDF